MTELIPSRSTPDALAAMERLIVDGTRIRAAVAFVTEAGVETLRGLLDGRDEITLELVARAADVTDPEALLALRHDLDAVVSVVIGRHASAFHPKLWLFETGESLTVLAGSGNLTATGLRGNDEQFELSTMPADSPEAISQAERFERLTSSAVPLDAAESMAIWTEWLAVIKKQRHHRNEIDRLGRNLARRDPQPDRRADTAVLIDDLDELYRLTVEANLSTPSGRVYVPSRFKQAIDRVRNGADPVQLVTRICRHASEGFDILLAHNRPDLTVEQLVVDAARPYHDLFGAQTRELSSQRLEEFPHADGTAQPLPDAVSSSAPVSSGSRGHKTTTVSQKDIDAGQVRIRIGPTKDRFPASPQNIRIVLRGRELTCWWNPRFNHDRERLGLIRVGTQAARDLLTAGEGLEVRFIDDSVHLD